MLALLFIEDELIGGKNGFELSQRLIEIVVDDQVVKLNIVTHFAHGLTHAVFNHIAVVLPSVL